MTDAEYDSLRPGDVLRGARATCLRVVVSPGPRVLALRRIGHSWTGRPTAWYDRWYIVGAFTRTKARATLRPDEQEAAERPRVDRRYGRSGHRLSVKP